MRKQSGSVALEPTCGPSDRRGAEPNGETDMSDTTQAKSAGLLKNKPLIFLVAAFALLIAVGIFTS